MAAVPATRGMEVTMRLSWYSESSPAKKPSIKNPSLGEYKSKTMN
jgi:hypothetical protein